MWNGNLRCSAARQLPGPALALQAMCLCGLHIVLQVWLHAVYATSLHQAWLYISLHADFTSGSGSLMCYRGVEEKNFRLHQSLLVCTWCFCGLELHRVGCFDEISPQSQSMQGSSVTWVVCRQSKFLCETVLIPKQNTPLSVHFPYVRTDKVDGSHVIILDTPDLQDQQLCPQISVEEVSGVDAVEV